MNSNRLLSLLVACLAISALMGCELRKPFEATVVAAGVDGSNLKAGLFDARYVYGQSEDGSDEAFDLDVDITLGRIVFFPFGEGAPTELELTPLQEVEVPGRVTFSLLDPAPDQNKQLLVVAWYDADGDGLLDLSESGTSETARTVYRYDAEDNQKAYLWAYNYNAGEDPYYTATALTGPGQNVIVTEEFLTGWMSVITTETEGPPGTEIDAPQPEAEPESEPEATAEPESDGTGE